MDGRTKDHLVESVDKLVGDVAILKNDIRWIKKIVWTSVGLWGTVVATVILAALQ